MLLLLLRRHGGQLLLLGHSVLQLLLRVQRRLLAVEVVLLLHLLVCHGRWVDHASASNRRWPLLLLLMVLLLVRRHGHAGSHRRQWIDGRNLRWMQWWSIGSVVLRRIGNIRHYHLFEGLQRGHTIGVGVRLLAALLRASLLWPGGSGTWSSRGHDMRMG